MWNVTYKAAAIWFHVHLADAEEDLEQIFDDCLALVGDVCFDLVVVACGAVMCHDSIQTAADCTGRIDVCISARVRTDTIECLLENPLFLNNVRAGSQLTNVDVCLLDLKLYS